MFEKPKKQVIGCFNNNQGWREIGGKRHYFRSKWESNYARYLEWEKEQGQLIDWFHEPTTFWFEKIKRGVRSYKPDFKVIRSKERQYYVEVKGYYDKKSLTKIKRFKLYYPEHTIYLIDKKWFTKHNGVLKNLIKGWE